VTFTVSMSDGTAVDTGTGVGSNDYNPPASTLTILGDRPWHGECSGDPGFGVRGGRDGDRDRRPRHRGEGATGEPQDATLVIVNDDAKPAMTLNTASGFEGDEVGVVALISGTAQDDIDYDLTFYRRGRRPTPTPPEVDDFDAGGIDGTIPAGTASGTRLNLGSIVLADDTIDEPTETIRAAVHDPSTTTPPNDRTSTYRIFDDPTGRAAVRGDRRRDRRRGRRRRPPCR
jgi:hypothetical protein